VTGRCAAATPRREEKAASGAAAVEAEDELVEIGLEMLAA